jgi:beta-lactamase regulating signal transducer with metallopeptidase domain
MTWLSCIISNVVLAGLLALAAWFIQHRLRLDAIARILWVLVLVKLVTPPLVSLPLREASPATACELGQCRCAHHPQSPSRATLPWILVGAWSVGAGATGWMAWRRWRRFRRLMAHGRPAPPEWQLLAGRLAAELGLRRAPELLAVPGRLPPLVVPGLRRPRILIPAALIDQLTGRRREALLLHELVHIKRLDHLVRLVELAVSVAYWWLPAVGSIGRQLRACEESCCDTAVLARLPHARRDYAKLLLDVLDFASPLPLGPVPQATAMSAAQDLEQRLRLILGHPPGSSCSSPVRSFAACALAVGLACAVFPCGLKYDFARRVTTVSSAVSTRPEPASTDPAAPDECPPGEERRVDLSLSLCCPS